MSVSQWIAIVEDEPDVSNLIAYHLNKNGFKTREFRSGKPLLKILFHETPSLIILDLMLPDMDGLEICKWIKNNEKISKIPIIIVTAKGEESERILGLEMGADDYVTKPFSPRELVARVKAVLRRAYAPEQSSYIIKIGESLIIDPEMHKVTIDGKNIELTNAEFKLLKILSEKKGRIFSREMLLDLLWGEDKGVIDRTIDVHIKNLREKLGRMGNIIKTVRGFGYKIEEE